MTKLNLDGKHILALIPARGGSKGVVRKNMRPVKGIPLVGYTLKAALKSKYINRVYMSSDDDEIINYAKEMGANAIRRPSEFANDNASANDVVNHFFSTLDIRLIEQDPYIIYLQPTSPLRTAEHIDKALEAMMEHGLSKLVSVQEMTKSPFKAFVLGSKGLLEALFTEESTNKRRQDLPKAFSPNGAIYIFKISDFKVNNKFPSNGSYPYIMNKKDSLDIDTEDDLISFCQILK
jgi:CMP-N,N'-diacetyllegionaminic acid synthase